MGEDELWAQFRRLLLGTVVEGLRAEGVAVAFDSISIATDDGRRERGRLTAALEARLDPMQLAALQARLRTIWPELLSVVEPPIGDSLGEPRHDLLVDATPDQLVVRFDLAPR